MQTPMWEVHGKFVRAQHLFRAQNWKGASGLSF